MNTPSELLIWPQDSGVYESLKSVNIEIKQYGLD